MWNLDQIDPIAFRIGPKAVYWYGILIALGFAAGIALAGRLLRREGLPAGMASDIGVWALVGGMLGGRLLYVVMEWEYYLRSPLEIPRIDHGGLIYHGGLIGGVAGILLFVHRRGLSLWTVLDAFSPALAIGQAFGRIGCLLNGCCYGVACHLPWAVWSQGAARHPVQLYNSLMNAAIGLGLIRFYSHRRVPGQIFAFYLLAHGCGRFLTEFLRGDYTSRPILGWMTFSQLVSVMLVIGGGILWWMRARHRQQAAAPSAD